jgi:hypothetical protein
MPQIEVKNDTNRPIMRGGYTIPPDGRWHTLNVPDYRIKEITRATYLSHRLPGQGSAEDLASEVVDDAGDTAEVDEAPEVLISDEGAVADVSAVEDSDDGDEVEEIDLDDLTYAELQEMAKGYGIKANQSRDMLTSAILAADEEG